MELLVVDEDDEEPMGSWCVTGNIGRRNGNAKRDRDIFDHAPSSNLASFMAGNGS